jgi:general secretion pathway protein D
MRAVAGRRGVGIGLVAALALALAGCAASSAFRKGESEAKKGNWDLAVARFTLATSKDPDNIRYHIALEQARIQASRVHAREAQKHLAAEELDKAAGELEIASRYDPANKSFSDDLKAVQEKIADREEEKRQRSGLSAMKARAQAARIPTPVLSPRSPVPITLKFADQSLQKILDSLGKLAGVNLVYDQDFRDKRTSVDLSNVTFEDALRELAMVNRFFYKVLDENTIIVVPESPAKHRSYDDVVVKTFYLENAEVNETLTIIKTVAGITKAVGNPTLKAITVIDTPDKVALAEKVVEANDKAKGEVLVEVEILEINRSVLKQYGIKLSNYQVQATFSPTGAANETANGLTSVRANILSSLNVADWVVSVPSTVILDMLQTDSGAKILAAPRLRAAEGKKTSLNIGQEVPIPVTTFTATQAGASTFAPATSFQYRTVGIKLELTPQVNAGGDVTLEMTAEFSTLGADRNVGTGQNPVNVPTFLTRNITGILRIKDGETSLVGGLIQHNEQDTLTGVFGLQSIPILNKIFTSRNKRNDDQEVLLSITPHVVRAPRVTEKDLTPLYVGTQETTRVNRSLFGEPEEETPPPTATENGGGAPPPTSPGGAAAAPPPTPAPAAGPAAPAQGAGGAASTPGAPGTPPAPGAETRAARILFSPPQIQLKAGETGAASVVAFGATGLTGVEVNVTYDANAITAVDVSAGALLTLDGASVQAERDIGPGRLHATFTRAAPATGSGAVVTIQFHALRPGSATLTAESVTLTTAAGAQQAPLPAPCHIEVSE